jgi:hypothetical protein
MIPAVRPTTPRHCAADALATPDRRLAGILQLLLLFPNIPGGGAAGAGGQRPPLQEIRQNFLLPQAAGGRTCG